VLKFKHLCLISKNKKLKVSGLRPPTFNNNLNDNNFGFNKPICKFDNNKILGSTLNRVGFSKFAKKLPRYARIFF